MQDKPRYSRVSDILDLAIFMSSKIQGVTINEIAERYNVSRRTAERMRDSLTCIFPSIDEIETDMAATFESPLKYEGEPITGIFITSDVPLFAHKNIDELTKVVRQLTEIDEDDLGMLSRVNYGLISELHQENEEADK